MSTQRFTPEFKIEAVKQVTECGLPVAEVAARLGMSVHSLYAWIKRYGKPRNSGSKMTSSRPNCVVCVPNSSG